MTFLCNTKLFPLQPEIKYMSMETIYLGIVIFLFVLAIFDLVVGVSNDAVNFLQSAVGAKAASFKTILFIAGIGVFIGAALSNGMMDIARHGIYQPEHFYFAEIMCILLAVMLTDVVLLDVFNTMGMPTSTTVSMVFELLGGTFALALIKVYNSDTLGLGDLINTDKALSVIMAIFVSVAIAFFFGMLVQWLARIVFTFNYKKNMKYSIALFGGIAATSIIYFMLIKGLKDSSFMTPENKQWIHDNTALLITGFFVFFTILMQILHWCKINVFKVVVLMGTFALALAFAGNDLVNFIGVPLAGYSSFIDYTANGTAAGPDGFLMSSLLGAAKTPWYFLIGAGAIMVYALCTSKKAHNVIKTSVDLARQDDGEENFGSTPIARTLVRFSMTLANGISKTMPESSKRWMNTRFQKDEAIIADGAAFDLVRASVNLVLAGLLIALGTSLKLPLSTTYVVFMVSMGSSLADRAWGRESAVYRITGVMTVISGWFLTAFVALLISSVFTLILLIGGWVAVILASGIGIYSVVRSFTFRKVQSKKAKARRERKLTISQTDTTEDILYNCIEEVCLTMEEISRIYNRTLVAVFKENRKVLREMVTESNALYEEAHTRKYEVINTLRKLEKNHVNSGHFYVQVVDYLSEVTKALIHITRPAFEHIDNNHTGLTKEQIADLMRVNDGVDEIFTHINEMMRSKNFTDLDKVLEMSERLFDTIVAAIKSQLRRMDEKSSTKACLLYLSILNETKSMVLQARNLLKSQSYFLKNKDE